VSTGVICLNFLGSRHPRLALKRPILERIPWTSGRNRASYGTNVVRWLVAVLVLGCLSGCSPRAYLTRGIANELARYGDDQEQDLILARDASPFFLKLSEAVLNDQPGHVKLAAAVTAGFTQYSYAFVATEAERVEASDAESAFALRRRALQLYRRAERHALRALELNHPGFRQALAGPDVTQLPVLSQEEVAVAYWGAAAWGAGIGLAPDDAEAVADLPLAARLAGLAWQRQPEFGEGALASLMGSFEAARPGGSLRQAEVYFDQAIAIARGRNAGVYVAKAESIALPAGNRSEFESLLRRALEIGAAQRDLANQTMALRARWLLDRAADLF
jgi:hypothetical protein